LQKLNTFDQSDENIRNVMTLAICQNNKAFIDIKRGNYENAFKICK
jgi:hypothetical protein